VIRPRITWELAAGAVSLTLGPDALHLDSELILELTTSLERADLDPEVYMIVIRHEGDALSLGCSPGALADPEPLARLRASMSCLIALARRIPKLIVVELAGRVEAEGLLLLRLGEVTLASADSVLRPGNPARIPGELLGIPGVDARRRFAVLLAGRDLTATEGAELGLVTTVVQSEQLGPARAELLARVRSAGPTAIARLKRMLWEASPGPTPRWSG
jgi:enoyl-CoA hydratase/carnithine racemase